MFLLTLSDPKNAWTFLANKEILEITQNGFFCIYKMEQLIISNLALF